MDAGLGAGRPRLERISNCDAGNLNYLMPACIRNAFPDSAVRGTTIGSHRGCTSGVPEKL
jgi:hypothetical protein